MESEFEHQLEHYLQGHFHPDVAPQVRREINLGTVSIEGFLRLAGVFQANHDAIDGDMVRDGSIAGIPQLEVTPTAQDAFRNRVADL